MSKAEKNMTTRATQGHRYRWFGYDVLAMESGTGIVLVRDISGDDGMWLGERRRVPAAEMIPQPMRYFGGRLP